jgi:hypothetical protein
LGQVLSGGKNQIRFLKRLGILHLLPKMKPAFHGLSERINQFLQVIDLNEMTFMSLLEKHTATLDLY